VPAWMMHCFACIRPFHPTAVLANALLEESDEIGIGTQRARALRPKQTLRDARIARRFAAPISAIGY